MECLPFVTKKPKWAETFAPLWQSLFISTSFLRFLVFSIACQRTSHFSKWCSEGMENPCEITKCGKKESKKPKNGTFKTINYEKCKIIFFCWRRWKVIIASDPFQPDLSCKCQPLQDSLIWRPFLCCMFRQLNILTAVTSYLTYILSPFHSSLYFGFLWSVF